MKTHPKLALYSTHSGVSSDALDERVMNLIGKSKPRIAYIPADTGLAEKGFEETREYYARLAANVDVFVNPAEQNPLSTQHAAFACDAIHLSGGDTFAFLARMRKNEILPLLQRYTQQGGVLIGVSAGAMLMAKSADAGILAGDWPESENTDRSALGLVDFHFWPHFDPCVRISSAQRRTAERLSNLHACRDGGGIVVENGLMEVYGDVVLNWRPSSLLALPS